MPPADDIAAIRAMEAGYSPRSHTHGELGTVLSANAPRFLEVFHVAAEPLDAGRCHSAGLGTAPSLEAVARHSVGKRNTSFLVSEAHETVAEVLSMPTPDGQIEEIIEVAKANSCDGVQDLILRTTARQVLEHEGVHAIGRLRRNLGAFMVGDTTFPWATVRTAVIASAGGSFRVFCM